MDDHEAEIRRCILIGVAPVLISAGALAEFQCAPNGASSALPEADPFFSQEVATWSATTKRRPTEGNGDCPNVTVPGYEGFPTKRCSYADADAGKGIFPALNAEVTVLNPSSRQLAAWSVHACRTNGATDAMMPKYLKELRDKVIRSNGAQFPVVGSVVESYCASSGQYRDCPSLVKLTAFGCVPVIPGFETAFRWTTKLSRGLNGTTERTLGTHLTRFSTSPSPTPI